MPWGHRGCPNAPNLLIICIRTQKKKRKKEQPVAPPDAPPYRGAISGREQELGHEANPGRRNFFRRSIRSRNSRSCSCCSPWQCDSELLGGGAVGPRPYAIRRSNQTAFPLTL
jgi:hypothetical protein